MAFSDLLKSELPSKKNDGFYNPLFEEDADLDNINPDMDTDYNDNDDSDAEEVSLGDVQGEPTKTEDNDELDDAIGDDSDSSDEEPVSESYEGKVYSNVKEDFNKLTTLLISSNALRSKSKFDEAAKKAEEGLSKCEKLEKKIINLDVKRNKPLISAILASWYGKKTKVNTSTVTDNKPKGQVSFGLTSVYGGSSRTPAGAVSTSHNYKVDAAELSSHEYSKIKTALRKVCTALKSDFNKIVNLCRKEDARDFEVKFTDVERNLFNGKMLNKSLNKLHKEDSDDIITDPEEMDDMLDKGEDEDDDPDLEKEITDADIEDIAGVDDIDEEDLSPEEEMEADNLMRLAATTELIKDELNSDERAEFAESADDIQIAINEGFLLDSDIDMFRESSDGEEFTESAKRGKIYAKTRVQFSKQARMAQLHAVAVNACASSKNDTDFIKLKKVNRMRRILRARLTKKYNAPANRLCRTYFQRLKNSKSQALQQIAKKNDSQDGEKNNKK